MKKKLLTLIPIVLTLAACGGGGEADTANDTSGADQEATENVNSEGLPIVDETVEMDFFVGKGAMNADHDWNDFFLWNEYEEMTNVDVNWNQVQTEALEEQRNLSLVQNELPDVYYLASFPNTDIYRYGDQEVFVPLNDYLDEYAPNLNSLMEENPEIRKAITFPDGNIYSMPSIIEEDFISVRIASRPWINQDWLAELGMDMPETTEEFYDYLVAVNELDPAGNGDTIALGGTSIAELTQYMAGSFGVMNRGVRNGSVDYDEENDQVRFYPTTDEYRELLEYMNRLYTEGLIDPNIFTIEWGQFLANASANQYGSMVFYDPIDLFGEEVGNQYNSMAALEGPNGDQSYVKVAPMVNTIGNFLITNENPNPAAAVRWMDNFYSDDGSKFYYMGVEGETFEEVDGELEYVDSIANPPEGSTFEQELSKQLPWIGATQGIIKEDYFNGSESAETSLEAADKIEPYVPEIWAGFTHTAEENDVLTSLGADIEKYVEESRDRFISGDLSFDNWDSYVSDLENMGLDEYMDVKQAAYERYTEE
jgi:putative aldouronate transport system substrate-binding protein